jgi:hypothetical protein
MNELDRRQQGDSSGNWYVMTLAVTKGAILDGQSEPPPEIGRLAASIEERKPAGIGRAGRRGSQVEPYEKYWVLTA